MLFFKPFLLLGVMVSHLTQGVFSAPAVGTLANEVHLDGRQGGLCREGSVCLPDVACKRDATQVPDHVGEGSPTNGPRRFSKRTCACFEARQCKKQCNPKGHGH